MPPLRKTPPRKKSSPFSLATLHHGTPGSYEKLATFANKNTTSVWGQRAALALGYDDNPKAPHAQQALAWL